MNLQMSPSRITTDEEIEDRRAALLAVLSKHWGYDSFRPLQREAMEAALEARDSLVVLPTGAGKSICYQAPALLADGLTIVVSPLISLMKDQVDGLVACGIDAAQLNSSLSTLEQRAIEAEVASGKTRLLFVSPERLAVRSFRKLLSSVRVDSFAIDEAHCISHWGHDFRPEYRQLRGLRAEFPGASLHAFTATATETVRRDIVSQLELRDPLLLVGSFDRPNLTYRIVRRARETEQIEEVIQRHRGEGGIIYCIRRRDVDDISSALRHRGYNVSAYHAGLESDERKRAQERFTMEECDIVVATVAFGMGIDRSNVRYVLHVGMPKSIEHYQQETGRAGRDGLEAECILLYSPSDAATWRTILQSGSPSFIEERPSDHLTNAFRQLDRMRDYCGGSVCRHRALVEYFGQSYDRDRCDACDICLGDFEDVADSSIIAQKILSCIVRLREPFGSAYITSVLRGENVKKVSERNHDQLSTFGLLRQHSKEEVRDWVAQLVGAGLLRQEGDRYPVLRLTEAARGVLRGEQAARLIRARGSESAASIPKGEASWEGVDRTLFENLRVWRRSEADRRGVPPFVVFGDATLRQLAAVRPSNRERLREVYGIGEAKLAEFGETLLSLILEYARTSGVELDQQVARMSSPRREREPRRMTAQIENVFAAFARGASIDEVMALTERARSTVGDYLCDYVRQVRPTSVAAWVSHERYAAIANVARRVGLEFLRPIRDELGESFSYEEIKLVVAHLRSDPGTGA